jgi:menaquinone-dependent protoporphyrinogen oxidase
MSRRILVTYASRTGTTAGVAEAIGETLAESGAQVDVMPVDEVHDLAPYSAVVAGSAIQGGQWLPEAMQFIQEYQPALKRKPFAAFLVCITMAMSGADNYRQAVAEWMEPVRARVCPVSEGLFAGALDIDRVPSLGNRLKFRLAVMSGVWKEGDHRDWDAIHEWASTLPPLLDL